MSLGLEKQRVGLRGIFAYACSGQYSRLLHNRSNPGCNVYAGWPAVLHGQQHRQTVDAASPTRLIGRVTLKRRQSLRIISIRRPQIESLRNDSVSYRRVYAKPSGVAPSPISVSYLAEGIHLFFMRIIHATSPPAQSRKIRITAITPMALVTRSDFGLKLNSISWSPAGMASARSR